MSIYMYLLIINLKNKINIEYIWNDISQRTGETTVELFHQNQDRKTRNMKRIVNVYLTCHRNSTMMEIERSVITSLRTNLYVLKMTTHSMFS